MPVMRAYELMIIFDGDLDEEAINGYLTNVTSVIESVNCMRQV